MTSRKASSEVELMETSKTPKSRDLGVLFLIN